MLLGEGHGLVKDGIMQKSVIEEVKELKARVERMTAQVKAEALDKANEAIGFLRVRPETLSRIAQLS
jgi:hypothetical protein